MASNDSCFAEAKEISTAADLTWRICTPVFIVLGTVGNSVSLVVFQRAKMRKNVLTKQLTALAASNLLIIYLTLLLKYCLNIHNKSIVDNLVVCKMVHWLSEPLGQFNSWLMVAITTERFIAVMKPLQMRTNGRVRNAKKQIFSIAFIFMLLNSHALYGYGKEYKNGSNGNETTRDEIRGNVTTPLSKCGLVNSTYKEFYSYWVVVQIVLLFFLPALLLFIGNIGIVLMLKKRCSNRILFKKGKLSAPDRLGSKAKQALALVLLLNTGFILSTAPISIYYFIYKPWDRQNCIGSTRKFTVTYAVANIIMYTQYSTGFLFFIINSDFRSEICRLLRLRKRVCLSNQGISIYSIGQISIDTKVDCSQGK